MKTSRPFQTLILVAAVIALGAPNGICQDRREAPCLTRLMKVVGAMGHPQRKIRVTQLEVNAGRLWLQLDVYDEAQPLTIDLVSSLSLAWRNVAYLVPSSSLNFKSSYYLQPDASLAGSLADKGFLVVGVTPREDNVAIDANWDCMQEWGIRKHTSDLRAVIRAMQTVVRRPYVLVGHSLAAASVLDYAALYSDSLSRVVVLDMPSFDPVSQPAMIASAQACVAAYKELLDAGVQGEMSLAELRNLMYVAEMYPAADSGTSRSFLGLPGNFTYEGLLHFALIYTHFMPGIVTELTGLPQEWPMVLGNFAGVYQFNPDPQADQYGLAHVPLISVKAMAREFGSGIVPLALLRDYSAAIADLPDFRIDWRRIEEPVVWVNGALGMGAQTHAAELIVAGGNTNVSVVVLPGYGHGDVLLSTNAVQDVWPYVMN